jgi:hypothetical protein
LASPIFPAKKERNWKSGKITESVTTLKKDVARRHPDVDAHVITIQGVDTTYTLQEKPAWHDECLFVIGESIQYVEDKRGISVVDQEGRECKLAIVHQQKRP